MQNQNLYKNSEIGFRTPLYDAELKARGLIRYADDMKLPRMLYAKMVWSTVPHAIIKSIDTEAAERIPGVRAICTWKNCSQVSYNSCGEDIDKFLTEKIFDQRVRYIGDRVAAVAADTLEIAERAAKLIKVEYQELPYYIDPETAMHEDAYPIHEGGNVPETVYLSAGDVDGCWEDADHVLDFTYRLSAVHHGAMEPHVAIADYEANGKLTIYSPSQDVFGCRANLSRIFSLPLNKVRVINPCMGGGFGGKIDAILEPVVAQLSIMTLRPVKITLNRREEIISTRTRHAMTIHLKTAVMNDGRIIAEQMTMIANAGAYSAGTSSVVWASGGKFFKKHKTPNLRFTGYPVFTNTPVSGAMRGFGSPQRCFAQERQMNRIARMLNISVLDLQMINLVDAEDCDIRNQVPHGRAFPKEAVLRGKVLFDWEKNLDAMELSKERMARFRIGVGMAVGVHGNGVYGVMPDTSGVMLKLNEDGSLTVFTGYSDMGNGTVTTQLQIISSVIGIPLAHITCVTADTETTMWDLGNYSSRGTFVGGNAALKAAEHLASELRKEAAEILNVNPDEIFFENGAAIWKGSEKRSVTVADIVRHAKQANQRDICVSDTFASANLALSYGAHFCKVSVDTETGIVKPLLFVAAHDLGKVINPMQTEGQIEGAIQMGLGYALTEALLINEDGKVTNAILKKYKMLHAAEMPEIRIVFVENAEIGGPFGAKSIGECSVVPVAAAVANAVCNALDTSIDQLPLTPDVVLRAIQESNMR